MRLIPPALPTGAVRRYGADPSRVPIPSDYPTSFILQPATLVCAPTWIAGYHGGRPVGVVHESAIVGDLAACGVAIVGARDGKATTLARWDLGTGSFAPLALVPHELRALACNEDATRIAALARGPDGLLVYDGTGVLRWERVLEDEVSDHGPVETLEIDADGEAVILHCHHQDRDDPDDESFSRTRVARDGAVVWERSRSRPRWFRAAHKRYGDRALGMVAISHDGARIATARAAWTRPEGVAWNVPEVHDTSAASSWGGEASVHSLSFDADGELLRVSVRGRPYMLERCIAGTSTPLTTYALPLPWTNRSITQAADGVIALADRVLMTASREARILCAFDGSAIAIVDGPYSKQQVSIFDADGRHVHTAHPPPGGPIVLAPRGAAMACHHVGGFLIVRQPDGEALPLVLSDTHPAFSPDGAAIAYGWNWRLHVMDLTTRQRRSSADLISPIAGLCYGRDGALFTELADGSVVEWDAGVV